MLETLVIADHDVDQAQASMLAVRNAGIDNPIVYARNGGALINLLSALAAKARPATLLIDLGMLCECGPELMRCLREARAPVELTALLANDKERFLLEQCGFDRIGYLLRPVQSIDMLRLLGVPGRQRPGSRYAWFGTAMRPEPRFAPQPAAVAHAAK